MPISASQGSTMLVGRTSPPTLRPLPSTPPVTGVRKVAPMRHGCPVGMSSAPVSGARPVMVRSVPAFCSTICIVTMRAPPPTTSCPSRRPYAPSAFHRPICMVSEELPDDCDVSENCWRSPVAATPSPPNCSVAPRFRSRKAPALAWLAGSVALSPWLSKSVLENAPGNEMPTPRS